MESQTTQKLSGKTIAGYSMASLGDAASYNLMGMYFIFFLTNVVLMDPVRAGSIVSTGAIVAAVSILFIGIISDNLKSKYGRRRPMLAVSIAPQAVAVFLMYTAVNFGEAGTYWFYVVVMGTMAVFYNVFLTPYLALGAEMTMDYDERTKLRTPATIMQLIGNIIAMSLPMVIIYGVFMAGGMSQERSWQTYGGIVAAICGVMFFVTWNSTRGKELPREMVMSEDHKENPFKTYARVFSLKPFRSVALICFLFMIGYCIYTATIAYFVYYAVGLGDNEIGITTLAYIFAGLVITPLMMLFSNKVGKRMALAIALLFTVACMLIFFVVGVTSLLTLVILQILFSVGIGAYWLLIYAMVYDVAEVYEFKYGERREASIGSLFGFVSAVSFAIAGALVGLILGSFGYDATQMVQAPETVEGIKLLYLVIPAILFALAAVVAFRFPITKARFELLMVALEAKRAGQTPDTKGLEKVL